jgi:hypothetical protein
MLRRRLAVLLTLLVAVAGISGALYAQLETADRGILPLDSSGTLEIGGIHVDVGAKDSTTARYAGWRIAQRQGFRALWAKMHSAPLTEAPNLPDSTLDDIVSSISVEREQIGPNRYIADLGVLFDRVRAAPFLGVEGGQVRRSNPMLLIPVMITGGTETSVELKNSWQRAWAQFQTSQSPIDYVRVSGLGADPMLINAAQADRPGRGWWRNLIDLYGAADILVAEVQVQRLYPGGPARGRFIGRHGPDGEIVGGFTLVAPNGDVPKMMADGVKRMDDLFQAALAAGKLTRDTSLNQPAPPPMPVEEQVETAPTSTTSSVQVQISAAGDVNIYNFAMAHLRTLGGIKSATPQLINPTGVSYVLVTYQGTLGDLVASLSGRGWIVTTSGGNVLTMRSGSNKPPPLPPPPPPPQPATPPQPQPAATPPGRQE